ncbi:hypothetical protein TCON_1266 [Astathelohania contejeani]|uniref:Uncharacterized protein n=1 Tax=Astathelohania contejeani TaxID=164912 RepID=A0ABQ7HZA4_9MICR|nr:hypothetical protein TCON_1266 [Thelohania contejeani]
MINKIYKFLGLSTDNHISSLICLKKFLDLPNKYTTSDILRFYLSHPHRNKKIICDQKEILSLTEIFFNSPLKEIFYSNQNTLLCEPEGLEIILSGSIDISQLDFEFRSMLLVTAINLLSRKGDDYSSHIHQFISDYIDDAALLKIDLNPITILPFINKSTAAHFAKLMSYEFKYFLEFKALIDKLEDPEYRAIALKYIKSQHIMNTACAILAINLGIRSPLELRRVDYDMILKLVCTSCMFEFCKFQPFFRRGLIEFMLQANYSQAFQYITEDCVIPFRVFYDSVKNETDNECMKDDFNDGNKEETLKKRIKKTNSKYREAIDLFYKYLVKKKKASLDDVNTILAYKLFDNKILEFLITNECDYGLLCVNEVINLNLEKECYFRKLFVKYLNEFYNMKIIPNAKDLREIYLSLEYGKNIINGCYEINDKMSKILLTTNEVLKCFCQDELNILFDHFFYSRNLNELVNILLLLKKCKKRVAERIEELVDDVTKLIVLSKIEGEIIEKEKYLSLSKSDKNHLFSKCDDLYNFRLGIYESIDNIRLFYFKINSHLSVIEEYLFLYEENINIEFVLPFFEELYKSEYDYVTISKYLNKTLELLLRNKSVMVDKIQLFVINGQNFYLSRILKDEFFVKEMLYIAQEFLKYSLLVLKLNDRNLKLRNGLENIIISLKPYADIYGEILLIKTVKSS